MTGEFKYNLPRLTENLKTLDIKFTNFSTYGTKKERIQEEFVSIVDSIFLNKLYTINENNIRFFMNWYSGYTDEQFKHQNFEIISSNSLFESLLDYCLSSDEEFLKYILMYIDLSEGDMCDKPEYIEQLLNNNVVFNHQLPRETLERDESDDSDNDEKIKNVTLVEKIISSIPDFYITYTQDKFNDLSSENREILINNLVINQKAEVNTEIVLDYFSQNNEEDNLLVDFINQNGNFELDKSIYLKLDKELQEKFVYFVLEELNMNKNIRVRLLKEIGYPYYETFNQINEDDNQMEHLIKYKLIDFNEGNLEFIRQKYPEHLASFIRMNKFDYLNTAKDIRDEEQIRELLENLYLSEIYRVEILVFLLDNNFNKYDFDNLINQNRYDSLDVTLQNKIQKIVKKYIRQFIALDDNEISVPLYESILNSNDVILEHKKELLKKLISDSESQIEVDKLTFLGDYLDLLELPDIMQILKEQIADDIYTEWKVAFDKLNQNEGNGGNGNQEAKVSYSKFNEKLLNYLKKKKLISNKSKHENSVLKLYGFRKKQIEYSDEAEEKQ
ncbi:hypothetical protein D8851_05540 [Streptococcus mitis]|nr:hypothetical protein D8851_05540 [Streptococcus mitis]